MQIEFVGKHVDLGDGLRSDVEERLEGARRFLDEPVGVRVVLESGAGEKKRFAAELHVSHRTGSLRARAESPELRDSVAEAAAAIVEQARRGNRKRVDRRRRAGRDSASRRQWPLDVVTRASVRSGGKLEILRSSHLEIETMTVDEAAQRLDHSRNEFYVFLDSESARFSVLYKRRDDQYGLISPEL